jgi:hypothetical protein
MRLCSSEIPDVDRITACMIRLRDQLSPQCRVFFRGPPVAAPVAAGRPMSIAPRKVAKGKASTAKTSTAKAGKTKKSHKSS